MDSTISVANPNLIEVIEACGEWFVRVVEDGKEDRRSFEIESYALAFARPEDTLAPRQVHATVVAVPSEAFARRRKVGVRKISGEEDHANSTNAC